MKNIRTIGLLILGFAAMLELQAQQTIVRFDYDQAGNRRERWLEVGFLKDTDSLLFDPNLPVAPLSDDTETAQPGLPTRVYPNPTYGVVSVEMPGKSSETVLYFLYDPQGKVVLQGETIQASTTINMQALQPGAYYLILLDGKRTERFKLIKH